MTVETLAPLPHLPRVADSVHRALRDAIIGGRLRPGSRLSVPHLAQKLDVSRSPVREAVQRLVQDGLATEEPHRGAAVAMLDPTELIPLYEVREALEGLAASLAARCGDGDHLAALVQAHREHAAVLERGESSQFVARDMAFHAALRTASHNRELCSYLERLQGKIAIAMLGGNLAAWSRHAIVEHEAILTAVLAQDPERAELAARAHIARVRADIAALHRVSADGSSVYPEPRSARPASPGLA